MKFLRAVFVFRTETLNQHQIICTFPPPGFQNVSSGEFLETHSIFQGFVCEMNLIIF